MGIRFCRFLFFLFSGILAYVSLAAAAGQPIFFPSQHNSIKTGAIPSFASADWNGDSYPDLVLLAREDNLFSGFPSLPGLPEPPHVPRNLIMIINDGHGGFAESWIIGDYQNWNRIIAAELDGKPPKEIYAVTQNALQQIEILPDKSLKIYMPIYAGENLGAAYPLDQNNDGITETFIIERASGNPPERFIARLNATGDALIEDKKSTVPASPFIRTTQYIHGTPMTSVWLENNFLRWQITGSPNAVQMAGSYTGMCVLDWDKDGIDDVLTSIGTVTFLKGLPEGGFETGYNPVKQPVSLVSKWPRGGAVVSGDLNEDGIPDSVTFNTTISHPMPSVASVIVSFGKKKDGAPADYKWDVGETDGFSCHAFLFDFNRDGHLDLLLTNAGGPWMYYEGKGNGFFTDPLKVTGFSAYSYTIPQMADFNGDNIPDFAAIASSPDNQVSPGVYLAIGKEDRMYEAYSFSYISPDSGFWGFNSNPTVEIGDANGDGFDDILFNQYNLWINRYQRKSSVFEWEKVE